MEIHTRPKLCHFGRYVVRAKLFCLKSFVPVTQLKCSYEKIFIPVTEVSVEKTEISVTGPAQPLIWTHQYFYKEKSGQTRSRKPSQLGRPGSYEEALSHLGQSCTKPFNCWGYLWNRLLVYFYPHGVEKRHYVTHCLMLQKLALWDAMAQCRCFTFYWCLHETLRSQHLFSLS